MGWNSGNLSQQATHLLYHFEANRAQLNSQGIQFGRSRLAVEATTCVYCALCLYGCPYELIYNSKSTVEKLRAHPQFHYQRGVLVKRLRHHADGVEIITSDKNGQSGQTFQADRVFLAGGPMSTGKIVLDSMEAYEKPLPLLYSQYFILPFFSSFSAQNVSKEKLHTLCQIFLEIFDRDISPFTVNLQLYTYNDLYKSAIEKMLGPLRHLSRPLVDFTLSRIMIFQGYLHSDHSPSLSMRLKQTSEDSKWVLKMNKNDDTKPVLKRLIKKLSSVNKQLGGRIISPMLSPGPIGSGSHTGGSFPMKNQPNEFETDTLGRLKNLNRVHLVDSSVFPSLPATTLTFSVMANAHRIGSDVKNL